MKKFFSLEINRPIRFIYSLSFILFFTACKKKVYDIYTSKNLIAIACPDQVISLPLDSVILYGGATFEKSGITNYLWTKIYGPDTFNIKYPTEPKTVVNNLVKGVYSFELKVTNNRGFLAKDTVNVTVTGLSSSPSMCNNSNRPQINAQLIPIGTLSQPRSGIAVAAAGDKILFAGGVVTGTGASARVDIYNTVTRTWSTAELSAERYGVAAIASGDKIYFAGGGDLYGSYSKIIDVYDVTTNTWTVDSLTEPRAYITATAIGNKLIFAGGKPIITGLSGEYSTRVDIYDLSAKTWSSTDFNIGRIDMTAVAVDNKLYLAGGLETFNDDCLDRIDVYDNASNSWSVSHLREPNIGLAGIAVNDKIFWAGGGNRMGNTCSVEIKDVKTGASSMTYLSGPGDYEGDMAVNKDNKIVFCPRYSSNKFDIYDTATNTWYIGILPVAAFRGRSIISVNNTIYIAGATVNGNISYQVWKLEF